jgi:hypothetical protein
MKKYVLIWSVFILVCIMVYLCGAFYFAKFDFSQWSERGGVIGGWVIAFVFSLGVTVFCIFEVEE